MTILACKMNRTPVSLARRVDVSAAVQQQRHRVDVAIKARGVESRATLLVSLVDVVATIKARQSVVDAAVEA